MEKRNMIIGTRDMERHNKCSRQHISNQQLTRSGVDIFSPPSNTQLTDYQAVTNTTKHEYGKARKLLIIWILRLGIKRLSGQHGKRDFNRLIICHEQCPVRCHPERSEGSPRRQPNNDRDEEWHLDSSHLRWGKPIGLQQAPPFQTEGFGEDCKHSRH